MTTAMTEERMIIGALRRSFNIAISRQRLQDHLQTMYPSKFTVRWSKALHGRVYSVPFYNSLWHIDGHHKLIRWKFVIHGGIDGFSRTIVFLQASDNNDTSTVTQAFVDACYRHGWPSRVRGDYGGEILGVKDLMEHVRGSFQTESSQNLLNCCRTSERIIHSRNLYTQSAY